MADEKKFEPHFKFRPRYDKDDGKNYAVNYIDKEGDQYGTSLCSVVCCDFGKPSYWKINETHPSDFLEHVNYVKFPTKEMAAEFYRTLLAKHKVTVEERPLTDDLVRYLEDRARHLMEEERDLNSRLYSIHSEQYALKKLAEKYKIAKAFWMTENSDKDAVIKDLAEFEVEVELEEGTFDEGDEGLIKTDHGTYVKAPFLSETALYNLIGKDDARSVLALAERVFKLLSPTAARKYL